MARATKTIAVLVALLAVTLSCVGTMVALERWDGGRFERRMSNCMDGIGRSYRERGAMSDRPARAACELFVLDENHGLVVGYTSRRRPSDGFEGTRRLLPAEIEEAFELRRAIVAASADACAHFWNGSDERAVMAAMDNLPDVELARFARFAVATFGAAQSTREPVMTADEAADIFDGFVGDLAAASEDEALAEGSEAGPFMTDALDVDDDDAACRTTRAILAGLEALAPAERVRVMQAWLVLDTAPTPGS